jgi:hypothetical protein
MLVALSITGMLLTATMVALDASFYAYASAAESASTQTSTRMVLQRVLQLARTGTAQGPMTHDEASLYTAKFNWIEDPDPSAFPFGNAKGDIELSWMVLTRPDGSQVLINYDASQQLLEIIENPMDPFDPTGWRRLPLLGGVTNCAFTMKRRRGPDTDYIWVLERGTIDITVEPDTDATLKTEAGSGQATRFIVSTAPRRLQ